MKKFNTLVSILNWNKAAQTLACIESLKLEVSAEHGFTMLVIDNASSADDLAQLEKSHTRQCFQLQCLSENLGFTGGHNIAIKKAIDENFDSIWLVNNDVIVAPGTSGRLLDFMDNHERWGSFRQSYAHRTITIPSRLA